VGSGCGVVVGLFKTPKPLNAYCLGMEWDGSDGMIGSEKVGRKVKHQELFSL